MRPIVLSILVALPAVLGGPAAAAPGSQPDPPPPHWNDPPPAGVETVKPMRPTWCAGHKPRPWLPGSMMYDDLERAGYSEELLHEVAKLACDRPDDPVRQQWIAFYRQGWLNIVGTTEKEDRDAMAARLHLKEQSGQVSSVCRPLWRTPKDRPPDQRLFNRLRAQAIGCDGLPAAIRYGTDGGAEMAAASYWIDRAAEPPDELVRLTWVLRCLNPGASSIDPATAHRALGSWSMCGHDAARLDRKRFDQAVAAMKLPLLGQVRAREMFSYTRKLLASYHAGFKAMVASDPDYGRIMKAADAGFAAWVELRAANREALDQALAMEELFREGDKRAVAGCSERLRAQLAAHIAASKPRTADEVSDAANDDVGQPILRALVACDSLEGRHGLVDTEKKLLGRGRLRRGPRTAALWAALDVVSDIVEDRTKFPLQPGRFGGPMPRVGRDHDWMIAAWEATFNRTSFDREQKGRVAKVKRQGDGVMVTFRTESWKEPVYNCKETNRIDRITPDGRVEYRQHCVAAGTETVKVTPRAVWIRSDLAAGIKPGVFVKYRIDDKPKPSAGYPLEVYADQAQKKLIQYWGFPVKP